MNFRHIALATLVPLALASVAAADDSGNFVVKLGQDTIGVEHYTRTASRIEVHQVGRAPRTLKRHFIYNLDKAGAVTKFSMVVTLPDSGTPTQTIQGEIGADSVKTKIESTGQPVQNLSVAVPKGVVVAAASSPWAAYEGAIMKLMKSKSDSLRTTAYFLGANEPTWLSLHKLGPDSVSIHNGRMDQFHVRVDKAGHILGVLPIAGTFKVSAERVANIDVDATANAFAAREKAGAGLGTLSPRDSVKTTIAGASLYVDYGRPGKRGRVIFGTVVPYGEVWRTGANAATQFKTDKALDFGGTVIPAGFYTLWTIPAADGWKLIVNSETGQGGTSHHADKDIAKIDMKVSALLEPAERFTISIEPATEDGVLNLDWDTTRASATFKVVN